MLESSPEKSCDDIYQLNKASREASGLYWVKTAGGTHQVYCNMELQCGGHKGGWTRVAQFDTSQGDACPPGWNLTTTPEDNPKMYANRWELQMQDITLQSLLRTISVTTRSVVKSKDTRKEILMPLSHPLSKLMTIM